MLHISGVLDQLEQLMLLEDGIIYATYGNPTCSDYIHSRHCNAVPGSDDAKHNTVISGCCICVKQAFKDIM